MAGNVGVGVNRRTGLSSRALMLEHDHLLGIRSCLSASPHVGSDSDRRRHDPSVLVAPESGISPFDLRRAGQSDGKGFLIWSPNQSHLVTMGTAYVSAWRGVIEC